MKEHLTFSLVVIIIEWVVSGVVKLNKSIDTTDGQILLAPA